MDRAYWDQIAANVGDDAARELAREHVMTTRAYVADLSAALNHRRRRILWGYAAIVFAAGLWGAWMGLCIPY